MAKMDKGMGMADRGIQAVGAAVVEAAVETADSHV